MRDYLNVSGIMTGNSLDGADLVLTKFSLAGEITDLCAHSVKSPPELADALRKVRTVINDCAGDMQAAAARCDFDGVEDQYTKFIARGVEELIQKAGVSKSDVDLIGSHGQTCAHYPPSVAQGKGETYTVQIGDAQKLANLTGITVVADFRSDDLMNGGEAAPLAPVHHKHLAQHSKSQGNFPIAFCNAGNTGNISIITSDTTGKDRSIGFDTGPFNDFTDKLMRQEKGLDCDFDGVIGRQGKINLDLLGKLFYQSVLTKDGANFLLLPPPRSSDPQWYKMIPELTGGALPFEDRLRTAQYFSAYIYYYSLSHIAPNLELPRHFALCGGGWKNPLIRDHFADLVSGQYSSSPVLPEHAELFAKISARITKNGSEATQCADSMHYGFDGTAMEARIFADAAFCRLKGEPFTLPETTGVASPTVAGIIRFENSDPTNATPTVRKWLQHFKSAALTVDDPSVFDNRWSRASAGWRSRKK